MASSPVGASLPSAAEWRRDSALPLDSSSSTQEWFQNYLDDFDAPEICTAESADSMIGKPSKMQVLKRQANQLQQIEVSDTKAVMGALVVERMGAYVDGDLGRVGLSINKLMELCTFGFWLLTDRSVGAKGLAMFLGRLIRAFEFRRPLMGILNDVWQYSQWEGRLILRAPSICEILVALTMLLMAFTLDC